MSIAAANTETPSLPCPSPTDLPPDDTVRWIARRKATVVAAVQHGLLSLDEACIRYSLTAEELESWEKSLSSHGVQGLKATAIR
ncbi:MAG: DUF1153 domain-containing protein [Alphaproteobacteria bacterium]